MANTFFQFKGFRVDQEHCAMKVCTDACLFGAWVADMNLIHPKRILDIGTGTGLLSLMLAQKFYVPTDAIELDDAAARQAAENFSRSPWKEKLKVIHDPVQDYQASAPYDLILSNPPFYEDDLKSEDQLKNAARHDTTLTLEMLLENILRLGDPEGFLSAILIPAAREEYFLATATKKGFSIRRVMRVRQTPGHSFFRSMVLLGKGATNDDAIMEEMSIKDESGNYSGRFSELLKDYYIHL